MATRIAEKIFPMDRNLKDRLPDLVEVFMWYMIRAYEQYGDADLDVPEEVRNATDTYRKANDFYAQFIDEKLERTGNDGDKLSLTVIYGIFKDFYKDSYPSKQHSIPGRAEVGSAMEKMLGRAEKKIWRGIKLLAVEDPDAKDEDNEDPQPDDVVEDNNN
jgi:phage/plasmid-associated DNA primase